MKLVYRSAPHIDALTFAPLEVALEVDRLHRALEASTWGAFRTLVGPAKYRELFADAFYVPEEGEDPDDFEGEELEPSDSEGFEADRVPGFSEGDFPPWLAPEMDRWVPAELLGKFGVRVTTVVNGSYWRVPAANAGAMVAALRGRGFEVEERGELRFW